MCEPTLLNKLSLSIKGSSIVKLVTLWKAPFGGWTDGSMRGRSRSRAGAARAAVKAQLSATK
jgi:hypothetical protein